MKSHQNKSTQPAKPILVRLPSAYHREAFERLCKDSRRSMDGQASIIIVNKLIELGYIEAEKPHTTTQS